VINRQENEELVLRFFALNDQYPHFQTHRGIGSVLDDYMESMNSKFDSVEKNKKKCDYEGMLNFVEKSFIYGFSRGKDRFVSRTMFEAISVGVNLALKNNPNLKPRKIDISKWMQDKKFSSAVAGERRTHTDQKIRMRIEYVRDKLLND
jgi:hypothetical protein